MLKRMLLPFAFCCLAATNCAAAEQHWNSFTITARHGFSVSDDVQQRVNDIAKNCTLEVLRSTGRTFDEIDHLPPGGDLNSALILYDNLFRVQIGKLQDAGELPWGLVLVTREPHEDRSVAAQ